MSGYGLTDDEIVSMLSHLRPVLGELRTSTGTGIANRERRNDPRITMGSMEMLNAIAEDKLNTAELGGDLVENLSDAYNMFREIRKLLAKIEIENIHPSFITSDADYEIIRRRVSRIRRSYNRNVRRYEELITGYRS